ncbi:MAG TPA: AMP-binding protein, partial [Gammaproteobacteria bacterium]|nr:AMP-binding protein [Gammaproteobacteria bacterium]
MVDVIEAIRRQSREHPTSTAVAGTEFELSYRELIELIDSEALQLSRTGHRTIAIAADNGPGWIVYDLAARVAGLTVVPLPTFFSAKQCSHVISDARVDAVVLDRAGESTLGNLIDEYHHAACGLRLARIRQADRLCSAPRPAKLSYTSGTTGTPKGVELSWVAMNRVANAISYVTQPLQISRHTCLLPFGLLLENVAGVYAALISGATVVCPSISAAGASMTGFVDGHRILQTLAQTRADSAIMLPQLLEATVEALESGLPCPALSFVAVGGAKTPAAVLQRARATGLPVFEGYGLTECGSVVCLNVPGIDRTGSVGRPLPHANVR